jgi:hypothetical protein
MRRGKPAPVYRYPPWGRDRPLPRNDRRSIDAAWWRAGKHEGEEKGEQQERTDPPAPRRGEG